MIRALVWITLPVCLSIGSVLLPIALAQQKNIFELIRLRGIAGYGEFLNLVVTPILFFCSGLLIGAIERRFWFVVCGLTIAVLPVMVIAEVLLTPGHHNLFPIEILIYVTFALPTIGGAALGAALMDFFHPRRRGGESVQRETVEY
jgi:hypothetical protein